MLIRIAAFGVGVVSARTHSVSFYVVGINERHANKQSSYGWPFSFNNSLTFGSVWVVIIWHSGNLFSSLFWWIIIPNSGFYNFSRDMPLLKEFWRFNFIYQNKNYKICPMLSMLHLFFFCFLISISLICCLGLKMENERKKCRFKYNTFRGKEQKSVLWTDCA